MKKRLLAALAAAALVTTLAGCSQADEPTPQESQTGYMISNRDLSTFQTTLPSGRVVECIAVTYLGSAIQCWEIQE